jgi:hypothetical protein
VRPPEAATTKVITILRDDNLMPSRLRDTERHKAAILLVCIYVVWKDPSTSVVGGGLHKSSPRSPARNIGKSYIHHPPLLAHPSTSFLHKYDAGATMLVSS